MPTPAPTSSTRRRSARVGGEGAVGALDRHARAGPQPASAALWSPRSLTVMRSASRRGRRRQRVRVRLPPQPAAQEAPLQELAAGDGQPVAAAGPRSTTENVPGPFGLDRDDAQAVAQRAPERAARRGSATTSASVPTHSAVHQARAPRVADERRAGVDLMRERQEQREVGVEVHRPPRLVGHAPARQPVGRDAGGDQQREADGRGQDARVGPQQLPELVQHAVVRRLRVADGDQHAVRAEQVQRPRPELAVPAHEPVLADRRARAARSARRARRRRPSRRRRAGRRGARARSRSRPARTASRRSRPRRRARA